MAGDINVHSIASLQLYKDGTDIDRRNCKRLVPMKILGLGICRTGTLSLRDALKQLGYIDTYHMRSASTETPRDCTYWSDLLERKYVNGEQIGLDTWDKLLGHCQAVCDFPAAAFAKDLILAYPDAKVVLTKRDVDKWHESTTKTVWTVINDPVFAVVAAFDWAFSMYRPMLRSIFHHFFDGDFPANGRKVYHRHMDQIRQLVPPDRLLEFEVTDGWAPLCKFLREPIPETPFPRGNSVEAFARGATQRNLRKIGCFLCLLTYGVIFVLGFVAIFVTILDRCDVSWGD